MAIAKGDFVEIDYVGKLKDGAVFDTTDAKLAQEHKVFTPNRIYGPVIVCVGEHQILKGVEEALVGKEAGQRYTIDLPAEKAFGKKNAQLIKLVPLAQFHKQNIAPQPGLQLNIDGSLATVLRATGGRVLLDFNHPLAGKEVTYDLDVKRAVTDTAEQLQAMLKMSLNMPQVESSFAEGKGVATIPIPIPEKAQAALTKEIQKTIPALKELTYKVKEEPKPTATPHPATQPKP